MPEVELKPKPDPTPEVPPVPSDYKLLYNGMPVRYIRDAKSGDAGYHPGQPKQVVVEVMVEQGHTPYEIRVPASQLRVRATGDDLPDVEHHRRAWPPPAPERGEGAIAGVVPGPLAGKPAKAVKKDTSIDLNDVPPQPVIGDDEDDDDHETKASRKAKK